jgi:molybdopterin molybdotransferase
MVGLPGNPVSALVCGHLFLRPAVDALLGLPAGPPPTRPAPLARPLPAGGPRAHYMRAAIAADGRVDPFDDQDSSMQALLARADALVVQPAGGPALPAGALVETIPLR